MQRRTRRPLETTPDTCNCCPAQSVRAQLGECRALAEHLRAEVEDVSALLATRPFEAEELARKLPQLQVRRVDWKGSMGQPQGGQLCRVRVACGNKASNFRYCLNTHCTLESSVHVHLFLLSQDRLAKTESCMVASREDLSLKQVHAVGLEARVLQAESALRAGSSLLQVSAIYPAP